MIDEKRLDGFEVMTLTFFSPFFSHVRSVGSMYG